jgi:hypothetical protein
MKPLIKYLFLFIITFLIGCIEEEHYKDINEVEGTGLPIEVSNNTKVINVKEPYFESFDRNTNILHLYDISEVPELQDSNVLVLDFDTSGVIRIIKNIKTENNIIVIETDTATMEDVFVDADFKLSTQLMQPKNPLKSAIDFSDENMNALTDDDGFIHPVKMIIHTKSGEKIIKSASHSNFIEDDDIAEGEFLFGQSLHTKKDFSGESIYKSENLALYIAEGYAEFAPVFKFEFKFLPPDIDIKKMKISKGELHKLAFYSDRTKFDFKTVFELVAEKSIVKDSDPKVLFENILKVTFVFPIGPIPVYMDINCDILANLYYNLEGKIVASAGFQKIYYVTLGAEYNKGSGWVSKHNCPEPSIEVIPFKYDGNVNFNSQIEIYPRFEVLFYEVIGPFLEVVPYLESELNVITQDEFFPWNAYVDVGVDLRAGVDVKLFKNPFRFNLAKLYEVTIYSAPSRLSMVSGSGQSQTINKKLFHDFVVKVEDDKGNGLPLVPVFFFSSEGGSFENEIVNTDKSGVAKASFTSPSKTGSGQAKAIIKDGKNQQIGEAVRFDFTILEGKPPRFQIEVLNPTQTSATIKCQIIDEGDVIIDQTGILYSINEQMSQTVEKFNISGNSTSYSIDIESLERGTTYYVRAFAVDNTGEVFKGEIVHFETASEEPTVLITNIKDIEERSARAFGQISDDGGSEITERGFVYSELSNPDIDMNDEKVDEIGSDLGTGSFNFELHGLQPNKRYYVKAFARNKNGVSYSEENNFETKNNTTKPLITNLVDEKVNESSVKLSANVNDGGSALTKQGFVFKEEKGSDFDTLWVSVNSPFEKTKGNLEEGNSYQYGAFACNENGCGSSDLKTFKFESGEPSVTRPSVLTLDSQVSGNTVTLFGEIESNGGAEIEEWGFEISEQNGFTNGDGVPYTETGNKNGKFDLPINKEFSPGTYYYKAYAKNSSGPGYGGQKSFIIRDDEDPGGGDEEIYPPTVQTILKQDGIGADYAILYGKVTDNGGADIEEYGIILEYPDGTTRRFSEFGDIGENVEFSKYISNLETGNYRFTAYAENIEQDSDLDWKSIEIKSQIFTESFFPKQKSNWTGTIQKKIIIYDRIEDNIGLGEISGVKCRGWAIFDITSLKRDWKIQEIHLKIHYVENKDAVSSDLIVSGLELDPITNNKNREIYDDIESPIYASKNIQDGISKIDTIILNQNCLNNLINATENGLYQFGVGFYESGDDGNIVISDYNGANPPELIIKYIQ